MKERIVIDSKDVKCAEEKNYIIARKEKCNVEENPTNWEELKELCKDIKGVTITEEGYINVGFVYFTQEGHVEAYIRGVLMSCLNIPVAQNRTPQQMWQIIKSLIGE